MADYLFGNGTDPGEECEVTDFAAFARLFAVPVPFLFAAVAGLLRVEATPVLFVARVEPSLVATFSAGSLLRKGFSAFLVTATRLGGPMNSRNREAFVCF
jgi:hypothetical protein